MRFFLNALYFWWIDLILFKSPYLLQSHMIVKSDIQIVISLGDVFANLEKYNGIHLLSGSTNISTLVLYFTYEIKEVIFKINVKYLQWSRRE